MTLYLVSEAATGEDEHLIMAFGPEQAAELWRREAGSPFSTARMFELPILPMQLGVISWSELPATRVESPAVTGVNKAMLVKAAKEFDAAWDRFTAAMDSLPSEHPYREAWSNIDWQATCEMHDLANTIVTKEETPA